MRQASWSLVPLAKWGFSKVGACHQSVLTRPPPPRLVGLNVHLAWASTTPADASIWAAIGAVRPSPTIMRTKRRRLKVPAFTRSTSARNSRSSIESPSRPDPPAGWLAFLPFRAAECQDCRYQYARRHRYESQPERSVPLRRFETPETELRHTIGITTTFWVTMSFIRMNRAARFAGSISLSAAFHKRSYSSLRQRVVLRRAHLFSFEQISIEVKFDMNVCGSGAPGPTLYICRSV